MTDEHQPTHLDLFSGIGGFAIAAQAAGFRTVGFCEIEPYAQGILKEKFWAVVADAASVHAGAGRSKRSQTRQEVAAHGQVVADAERERDDHKRCREVAGKTAKVQGEAQERKRIWTDIGERDSPRLHSNIFTLNGADYFGVTLITGGFPCQPFSCAGKRRGKEDDRHLWPQMFRVIKEARPAWVLAENVPGLVKMELDSVLSDLESIGYATGALVVPACAVDARHRRDRVWIVAHDRSRAGGAGLCQTQAELDGNLTGNGGGVVADATAVRSQGQRPDREQEPAAHGGSGLPVRGGEDVSDAAMRGDERGGAQCGERQLEIGDGQGDGGACFWLPEPELGRVAHGIPHRAYRLRSLGNAIVPQVAQVILENIRSLL